MIPIMENFSAPLTIPDTQILVNQPNGIIIITILLLLLLLQLLLLLLLSNFLFRSDERVAGLVLKLREKDMLLTKVVGVLQDYRKEYDGLCRKLLDTAVSLQEKMKAKDKGLHQSSSQVVRQARPLYCSYY